jgi:hypothetical protein
VHVHHPIRDHRDEARKAIDAMRCDSISARIGEEASAVVGAIGLHPAAEKHVAHGGVELVVWDEHGSWRWSE